MQTLKFIMTQKFRSWSKPDLFATDLCVICKCKVQSERGKSGSCVIRLHLRLTWVLFFFVVFFRFFFLDCFNVMVSRDFFFSSWSKIFLSFFFFILFVSSREVMISMCCQFVVRGVAKCDVEKDKSACRLGHFFQDRTSCQICLSWFNFVWATQHQHQNGGFKMDCCQTDSDCGFTKNSSSLAQIPTYPVIITEMQTSVPLFVISKCGLNLKNKTKANEFKINVSFFSSCSTQVLQDPSRRTWWIFMLA